MNIILISFFEGSFGLGKSTIAASVIQELRLDNAKLMYFFFQKRAEPGSGGSLRSAIVDFLHQILPYASELQSTLYESYARYHRRVDLVSTKELWQHLRSSLLQVASEPNSPPCFLIVDALDEIDTEASTKEFTGALVDLARAVPKARILVTSRPLPSLANTFRQAEVAEIQLDTMQQALNNDVSKMSSIDCCSLI